MTAEQHITRADALDSERSTFDNYWQRILDWCTPHKAYVTVKQAPGTPPVSLANISRIHDTTAIDSCNTLADSHMSSLVPLGSVWFKWGPPDRYKDDESVVKWYERCSAKALKILSESNFYTAIYSLFRDRSGPGTGAMYISRGKGKPLTFTYMELGTYSVAENEDGIIDTLYRRFKLNCMEAVAKFVPHKDGEQPTDSEIKDKLGDKIAACYDAAMKGDAGKMAEKHDFIHGVSPRLKRDPKKIDAKNMPFESVYIVVSGSKIVEEGGFEQFPFVVSRFEKWGSQPYGFSPAFNAMPNILTANYLVKLLKAIGEAKAMPRIIELGSQKRQVDLRAGGRTVVSKEEAQLNLPRQWADAGDFELGQWLIEQERLQIRKFFFTDLFKMFSSMDPQVLKDMTAEVARGLKSENLLLLAPSFTQFATDFRPCMERIFALCLEAGEFDEVPEVIAADGNDGGMITIPEPITTYISRIGLALAELEDQAADQVLAAAGQAAALQPDILDNLDLDKWIRNKRSILGANPDIERTMEEVTKFRAERAEAIQQQQQMAAANMAANTAAEASKGNPSVISSISDAAA